MLKKIYVVSQQLVLSAILLATAPIFAGGPVNAGSLQGILDDITIGGDSSVSAANDGLLDVNDSYWNLTSNGGSWETIIAELAGYQNTTSFGIYDFADPNSRVQIFGGADTAGATRKISISATGQVYVNNSLKASFADNKFGYYLDSISNNTGGLGGVFYSDSGLNTDGQFDHMYAYQGEGDKVKLPNQPVSTWSTSKYVLAWEDLRAPYSDSDYNDFVVMVASVQPTAAAVPEPGTYLVLGIGLLLAATMARRSRSVAR